MRYEQAKRGGVFYFWGHSHEMITEARWRAFAELTERISADPGVGWGEVTDLFDHTESETTPPDKPDAGGA